MVRPPNDGVHLETPQAQTDSADMASAVVVRMPPVLPTGESGDHVDVVPAVVQLKGGMPSAFIVVGGDDGGQWRQFDPGG